MGMPNNLLLVYQLSNPSCHVCRVCVMWESFDRHSLFISQTSESTPTTTGWFEVQVNGVLVHSKKVRIIHFAILYIPEHLTHPSKII